MPKSLVAERLGCSQSNLEWAQRRGMFKVFRDMAPANRFRFAPVTYLYTPEPVDPSSPKLRKFPDPLWGTTARFVADHIPDNICQTITRVPLIQAFRFGDTAEQRARPPRMLFRGWKWVCPGCAKTCRVLYYPLRPLYGIQLLKRAPKDRLDWLPDPLEGFACTRCHNVLHFTRINACAWNHLITHLSGGLLYGHEVARPSDVMFERKRAFRPVLNCPPSKRGAEVQQMLAEGLSYSQIALRMRVTKSTVASYARRLYQRRGVKGVKEFRQAIDCRMPTVE
jgi:DNA-binding CsgD family transcriptional regulator